MDWNAISAVAGSLAAIAALLALLRATGLEAESIRDRAAAARAGYFKALLTRPLARASDRLSDFLRSNAATLGESLSGVTSVTERDHLIADCVADVNESFAAYRAELRVATGAWKDDLITQSLFRETQDWEDETQRAFEGYQGPKSIELVRYGCTAYRTALRRILLEADPLLVRAEERERLRGWFARFVLGA